MRRAATWPCTAAWSRGTTLANALAAEQTLAQVLQPDPAGVQVLPSFRELVRWHETAEHAWNRLMTQLASLSPRPEAAVIDAGNRPDPLARQLWQAADRVLLVTTVEAAAIMDTYASIKLLSGPPRQASIALLVNPPPDESAADEAQPRLAHACRRFLGLPLQSVGCVPGDGTVPQLAARGEPWVLAMPACPASLHLRQVARAWENHRRAAGPRRRRMRSRSGSSLTLSVRLESLTYAWQKPKAERNPPDTQTNTKPWSRCIRYRRTSIASRCAVNFFRSGEV